MTRHQVNVSAHLQLIAETIDLLANIITRIILRSQFCAVWICPVRLWSMKRTHDLTDCNLIYSVQPPCLYHQPHKQKGLFRWLLPIVINWSA